MYNRISLTKKTKKRSGQDVGQEVGLKGVRNVLKGVWLQRDPHKAGGLESFMLLINYLGQTNLMTTTSKFQETMTMMSQLFK